MNIGIIGTGYVGLVSGACLADFGWKVFCMDIDKNKIDKLKNGEMPIFESGLEELVIKNLENGRMEFNTNMNYTVENSDVIFIAVGTPPQEDGSADMRYVLDVAGNIGKIINNYKVIVNKSTVPVGTGKRVREVIENEIKKRDENIKFDVVSNPEFLREGKALYDFMHPDRVVIGSDSETAIDIMKKVYKVLLLNQTPFVSTNIETAEMIKYASNAFLAVKISFINEMALLAEKVGADIQDIAKAMGMDGRISPKFLNAGAGYGGSCFPKDTRALYNIAKENNEEFYMVKAAIEANEKQKRKMVEKILEKMGDLNRKNIAVLGLTFKPDTDDVREAPSIDIIKGFIEKGALIRVFCPQGIKESKWRLKSIENNIFYAVDEYDAAKGADAIVLVTEWNQFRAMSFEKLKSRMNDNYFFDLRNVYYKDNTIQKYFKYFGVGI